MKTIGILGEGAWGTALANLCADNGHTVYLWCHDKAVRQTIQEKRENTRYLPGIAVHPLVVPTCELSEIFAQCSWVIETTPVQYLRSVLESCQPYVTPEHRWVVASKGIEQETLLFPTQMIDAVFGFQPNTAVLVGPSFARDLAQRAVTAVDIAAPTQAEGALLQELVENSYFRPVIHTDFIGAQVGATVKNVLALGMGMLQGAGYADNTRALFFTRGLQEMAQLAVALGCKRETVYGLSGVGDALLTCFGAQSRNREVGYALGKGVTLDALLRDTGYIPEGVNSVKSVHQLAQKYTLSFAVCKAVHDVIFEGEKIDRLVDLG